MRLRSSSPSHIRDEDLSCGYPARVRLAVASLVAIAVSLPAANALAVAPKQIRLFAPAVGVYGKPVELRGRMIPAQPGARVRISVGGTVFAHATVRRHGGFRVSFPLRAGGPYRAGFATTVSPKVTLRVRPTLETSLVGEGIVGLPLTLYAQLHPSQAGAIRVEVDRGGHRTYAATYQRSVQLKLGTTRFPDVRVQVRVMPHAGFTAVPGQVFNRKLVPPELRYGSEGLGVSRLLDRLAELHYAVRRTSSFGSELFDSVIAFQKVQGLERDGVVGPNTWKVLTHPRIASPRYTSPADHLEVDKTHQVLYVVRGGKLSSIIPVSTAGIAGYYTPEGAFSIYRKVPGFDNSPLGTLYLPMYFTGGYAIHGNPSVPAYPASHGCIRVPMWIADALYASNGYGETVYVYS